MTGRAPFIPAIALAVQLWACGPAVESAPAGHDLDEAAQAYTSVSPAWQPTAAVLAAGDQQHVTYNGQPLVGSYCTSTNPWTCSCGSHPACSSGLPGTLQFATFLKGRFPQISSAGGLGSCCRQSTGGTGQYLSVHSLGRAIDLMIPELSPGVADNAKGDPIAAWLIQNAQSIGVQYVAWDQAQWSTSKPPGARFGPYTGSLSHTNHLHVELNLAGANKQTPFFTSGTGSGGGTSCTPRCNGSVIVRADCGTGDCAAYGATCLADPTPRCVHGQCPATGTASVCLDSETLANCSNGLVTGTGKCSAFGAYCSTAGVAATAARCVLSLCVSGPSDIPRAHVRCSITRGKKLDCKADGSAVEVACPTGQVCSMESGNAECVAPLPECPVPAAGTVDDRRVCLASGALARCFNGNVIDVDACGEDSRCTTLGGAAHCASRACLEAGNPAGFCTPYGSAASCNGLGMLDSEQGCAPGTECQVQSGVAACITSAPATPDAGPPVDAGTGGGTGGMPDGGVVDGPAKLPSGCGCGSTPGGQPFSVLALMLLCVQRCRRVRAVALPRS